MGLTCADYADGGDGEWWFESNFNLYPLNTKRDRKCCSCGGHIKVGEQCAIVHRSRSPKNDIEERIYSDMVPMATWYLCETCDDLAVSLDELGFCFSLGDEPIADQIKEYRKAEREAKEREAVGNLEWNAAQASKTMGKSA